MNTHARPQHETADDRDYWDPLFMDQVLSPDQPWSTWGETGFNYITSAVLASDVPEARAAMLTVLEGKR